MLRLSLAVAVLSIAAVGPQITASQQMKISAGLSSPLHDSAKFRSVDQDPSERLIVVQAACGTGCNDTSGLRVGSVIDAKRLHQVTRPGLYGVGEPPRGSRYGIIDGRLVRYDPTSMRIQSVIRNVDEVLD